MIHGNSNPVTKTILTELNKEAEDYANEMYRDQVRSQIPGQVWEEGHIAWLDLVYEKFAQLIVRECIAQCEKNKDHEWLGSGSKLSAFNIREHFGVK